MVLVLFAYMMVVVAVGLLRRYPARAAAAPFVEHYTLSDWARLGAIGLVVGLLIGDVLAALASSHTVRAAA